VIDMGETRTNLLDQRDVGRTWLASTPDGRPYQELVTRLVLLAGDIGVVAAGAVMAAAVASPPALSFAVACVVAGACVGVNLLLVSGGYRVDDLATRPHRARILPAVGGLLAYATLLGQLTPEGEAEGAWLAAWAMAAAALLTAFRLAAQSWWLPAARGRRRARRVVVAGERALAEQVAARLATSPDVTGAARVVARVDLATRDGREAFEAGLAEVARLVESDAVDAVLLAVPWDNGPAVQRALEQLGDLAVEIFLASGLLEVRGRRFPSSRLGGVPCLLLVGRPIDGWGALAKDVFDRLVAAAALVAIAPALLLITVAIRLDSPGPILFRQKRHGLNGRVFEILKFRTMHANRCDDGTGEVAQAVRRDPRITRVGRWLRRTSMDELPQLINVLKGEMSIVGPRPQAVAHNQRYAGLIEHYAARHRMKPGITGWAQVNGCRGETDTLDKMARRIEHDLDYIENWSLGFDLRIVLRTFLVGFVHPEAR
jgi:putative colanic acid biosynthesis UDP-glucose lipid carrier transferase